MYAKTILALFIVLVISCSGGSKESSDVYMINILSKSDVPIEEGTLRFTVFGAPENFQDGSATIIQDSEHSIDEVPSTILMEWPERGYESIIPPVNSADDAIYFFNLTIDINGDGHICEGDYIRDFESSPFFTIKNMPAEEVDLYVRELQQGCNYY